MAEDEAPTTRTIPVQQIHEQGVAAINLIYGAFQSVSKQNETLKDRNCELEAENKKLRAQIKRLEGVRELLNKFLSGGGDGQEGDIPSEVE